MAPRTWALVLGAIAWTGCSTTTGEAADFSGYGDGSSTTGDVDTSGGMSDPSTTNVTTGISVSATATAATTASTISASATEPDTEGAACKSPADCDEIDGDPCTWPVCGGDGTCSEVPAECDGESNECADATCNPRTGACEYTANDDNCEASAQCNAATCELVLDEAGALVEATCEQSPVDGEPCDDGDGCTQDDTCDQGVCDGQEVACDSPPAPTCDGQTLQTSSGGVCSGGSCEYDVVEFTCPSGCTDGMCEPPDHPIISEVLYDSESDDTDVWIELWAPPGSSLSNVVLEAVNGNGGTVYATLALSGTTPDDGIVLIVFDSATDPALTGAADFTDPIADLQNGPDNLRVLQGGAQVDALGYGNFGGAQVFAGEGSSSPDASPGRSLARALSIVDTNDNAADFTVETEPTPGEINPG